MAGAAQEIAPGVTRVAISSDSPPNPPAPASSAQSRRGAVRSGCRSSPVSTRDAGEMERAVAAFARSPNGGLIVAASGHRDDAS